LFKCKPAYLKKKGVGHVQNPEMMEFRTKTGICKVNAERLEINREGIRGKSSQTIYGKSIYRALTIYAVLALVVTSIGIWSIINSNYLTGSFFTLVGLVFFANVILSRNNTAVNLIERSTVDLVEAHPPHPPLTRAYFVVHYSENDKKRKRMIMLPGSLFGGSNEYKKALAIMIHTGWYTSTG
jgi:hypothetical protein